MGRKTDDKEKKNLSTSDNCTENPKIKFKSS